VDSREYYALAGTGLGYEVDEPGTVPVDVAIRNQYAGFYVSDTFNITSRLAITAGGRFNIANINLHNERAYDANAAGGGLNGGHYYQHFNPAATTAAGALPSGAQVAPSGAYGSAAPLFDAQGNPIPGAPLQQVGLQATG